MTDYFERALAWLDTNPTVVRPLHRTTRTFGFELRRDGRQLAIKPQVTQITVLAKVGPWQSRAPLEWKIRAYTPRKGRSSNLRNCAPRLDLGREAASLALKSYADFERFVSLYT
jgi:hypothetical protein